MAEFEFKVALHAMIDVTSAPVLRKIAHDFVENLPEQPSYSDMSSASVANDFMKALAESMSWKDEGITE
ncbi:hypothetical protein SEA_STEVIEBAY_61 [Arthrobacter phage StevieBAY]|uniref:Uncharacterized protein n=1 Tax=Arthrobacter phage StevieBAY TaxID=2725609 RepID=A0A6M3TBF7_9CAUD|nr:hypothetical protein SEA_STEVIEBAY_61 [Arthrobacter phage StevieBAY]